MITSPANGKVKRLVLLREKSRVRNQEGLFIGEGIKMFMEAPLTMLQDVYVSESFWQRVSWSEGRTQKMGAKEGQKTLKAPDSRQEGRGPEKAQDEESIWNAVGKKLHTCMEMGIYTEQVSDEVMKKAADTQTPQGILFVMKQFSYSMEALVEQAKAREREGGRAPFFLLLEDVQDPGNLGTMLRTGEGAGVDGVIMSRGTADVYNPKTIRSTMGSLYRVPFLYVDEMCRTVNLLKQNQILVYAAHLKGERYFDEISYQGGCAFLVGNEGKGLRKETAACADIYLKIPMEGKVESLNAAVAAALLLYQAAGWRRGVDPGGSRQMSKPATGWL